MKINYLVLEILNRFESSGFEAYLVGGAVRDYFFNHEPKDFDICTNATVVEMQEVLHDYKVFKTGLKHNTITVINQNLQIEVTTYKGDSLKDDLQNRDFTINAIAYNQDFIYLDGSKNDLDEKVLRFIDGIRTINDDPLRILRAIKIAGTYELSVDKPTRDLINQSASKLASVSVERIRDEFCKIILLNNFDMIIRDYFDVFVFLIPQLKNCAYYDHENKYHIHTLLVHILQTLSYARSDLEIRMALLFHDLGKLDTFNELEDGKTFYGHGEVSASICMQFLTKYKFTKEQQKQIYALVIHHDDYINVSKKSVKKYLAKHHVDFEKLLEIKRYDILAQSSKSELLLKDLTTIDEYYREIIANQECFDRSMLAINGHDLYELGYRGSAIKLALEHLLTLVIEDEIANSRDELLAYIKTANLLF